MLNNFFGVMFVQRFIIFVLILFFSSSSVVSAELIEVDLNLEEKDLAYTFFDLSNGEATLLQSGKGQNILIDTGSMESQEQLEERLDMYHINVIDTIIITNRNDEFTGNLEWVVNNYHVNTIIVPDVIKEEMVSFYHLYDKEVIGWKKGDKKELIPFLNIEVIYVEERDIYDKGALVIKFSYGKQTMLYMGIADKQVENELVANYSLKSTILKVADFGSEKGTTQSFLDEVDPQVAILFKKRDKVVSELVLERLQETWIDIYQTHRLGTVSIKCHNDDYEILTVRPEEKDSAFGLAKYVLSI